MELALSKLKVSHRGESRITNILNAAFSSHSRGDLYAGHR